MYLVTHFSWPVVREFHTAVLFEIECSRARWGDSFAHLESRLLCSTTISSISSPRPSGAVLFCRDFQTGKCSHTKDHYGTIRNERKWLQHICARCWMSSRTIVRHSARHSTPALFNIFLTYLLVFSSLVFIIFKDFVCPYLLHFTCRSGGLIYEITRIMPSVIF